MKGGDADEFIDYITEYDACVRHKGYVYRFLPLSIPDGKRIE